MKPVILGAMIGAWEILIILLVMLVLAGMAVGLAWIIIWFVRRDAPFRPPMSREAARGEDRPRKAEKLWYVEVESNRVRIRWDRYWLMLVVMVISVLVLNALVFGSGIRRDMTGSLIGLSVAVVIFHIFVIREFHQAGVRGSEKDHAEDSASPAGRQPQNRPLGETLPGAGICHRCGSILPSSSPQGLCPRCVMGVGVATNTEATGELGSHGTKILPPPQSEVIRRFPQLEILECLGQGGMGVVYKARQPKLNRLVALKILAPEKGANPKFAERFQREAQALARLNHPNIVMVHDYGEADGMFFLLMEYVDGMTLRKLQREGHVKPEEALAIVPPICEALQYAHGLGVVHRDIKPENVLLDKQGRVKIADFGIAKLVGSERPGPVLTEEHAIIGTPHYMAPEQVEKPQLVDHRADIYSLGVVFYEMLTGELPLGKFQPPSKKVQVDVRLDEVVLRALEKEPDRRYQQASHVKTDVETIARTPGALPAAIPSAPTAIDTATMDTVARQVKGPAEWLVATGILNAIAFPLVLMAIATLRSHSIGSPSVSLQLVLLFLCGVEVAAGLKMKRIENYRLAITGSILAMIINPCFIGLPVGIWALVVLNRPEVRETFQKRSILPAPEAGLLGSFLRGDAWKAPVAIAGIVLLILALPPVMTYLSLAAIKLSAKSTHPPAVVVAVEQKLRNQIIERLAEGGWKLESLSVNVTPDLREGECHYGKIWKNGLSQVPPPPAAIYLEPQGEGLWLVRGEGEFQSVRFSVDVSAEMASALENRPAGPAGMDPDEASVVELAAQFEPDQEAWLDDADVDHRRNLFDLDTGRVLSASSIPKTATGEQVLTWLRDEGVDFAFGQKGEWALFTPSVNAGKLIKVTNTIWDGTSLEQFERESAGADTGLSAELPDAKVYFLGTNVVPPVTFVFATANGARGLLQISEFREASRSAQIRFKRLRSPAPAQIER